MKKLCITLLLGFSLAPLSLLLPPESGTCFTTGQSADIAVGQPNMTSNNANQGGAPAANTLYAVEDAFGAGNRLFVADVANNRILIFNTFPAANNAGANAAVGQPNLLTNTANSGGLGAGTLNAPWYASTDGTRLFVSDAYNHRVLIYNTIPSSSGANANMVIGQADMTGNCDNQCTTPSARTLHFPLGLCVAGSRLCIADAYNNRVLIFNSLPSANNTAADVVVGQPDMTSSDANHGGLGANTLSGPVNVASDGTRLFISEYDNNRVLIFNAIPTANNTAANVVVGQPNMISNDYNSPFISERTLYHPRGIFSDGNRLFIADYANHRVLLFNSLPTANNAGADIVLGQSSMMLNFPNFPFLGAETLRYPRGVHVYNNQLMVADAGNNRVLIYTEPTATASPTVSVTASPTPSATASPTVSPTRSATPILSPTPTYTATPSASPTASRTASPTITPSRTRTPTRTATTTRTPTPTLSATCSATPTATGTNTLLPTRSITTTPKNTATLTNTATPTPAGLESAGIRVYPIPFRRSQAVSRTLKITGLTPSDRAGIYTLSGEKVYEAAGVSGRLEWDGKNRQDSPVAAGYYFWVVEHADQTKSTGKILIME